MLQGSRIKCELKEGQGRLKKLPNVNEHLLVFLRRMREDIKLL